MTTQSRSMEVRAGGPDPAPEPDATPVIVVAEDDEDAAALLARTLELRDYDVRIAPTGPEALRHALGGGVDVLLLDLGLPEMSGAEILARVRADEKVRDLPVVILSAQHDPDRIVEVLVHGANDYVTKPVHPDVLLARVQLQVADRRAREELKRLNQMKDEFLGIASHDLQNPISTIVAYSQWLLEGASPVTAVEQREPLGRIYRNATFMHQMVGDLLDLIRIEAGRLRLHLGRVVLGRALHEVVDRQLFFAADKGIQVAVRMGYEVPDVVADAMKLQQVIGNLLSNALKFSPLGARVSIGCDRDGDHVAIAIADDGPGIPADEMPRLFRKYARLADKTGQDGRCAGLGLVIAKSIVELHGGTIGVESEVGRGTTFRIRLPVGGPSPAPSL